MKQLILVCLIMVSVQLYGQDSTKVGTPIIVAKLYLGKSLNIDNVEVKFVKVLQDSRCPKGVTCIWAGEVIVLVDVFKEGKKFETQKITINSKIPLKSRFGNLFSSDDVTISALNVQPYPIYDKKINPEDYYIQLEIKR
ncbi:MAG: hypothetical protein HKO01_02555 [Flaviramulus sp.]|nr:hypothetical protein [Flaviramulus sp.]NNC49397.1 hypothetical protein [Flaviramulus sp.]